MVFLKMASDTALLMIVAGPVAVHFGAPMGLILFTVFLSAVSMSLSYALKEKKVLKFLPFLLEFIPALLPERNIAWAIPAILVLAYGIYSAASEKLLDDIEHQRKILKVTLGITAAALFIFFIFGLRDNAILVLIISALIALGTNILLMRSLRHEPEVYGSFRFQALNIGIIAVIMGIVLFLSSESVVNGFILGIKAVYTWIATGIMYAVLFLIRIFGAFFSWLGTLFSGGTQKAPEEQPMVTLDTGGIKEMFPDMPETTGLPLGVKIGLIVVAAAIVLLVIYLIFRKLAGKRTGTIAAGKKQSFGTYVRPENKNETVQISTDAQGVRKQYRKYLQYLKKQGQTISTSDTSQDVENASRNYVKDAGWEASEELRRIYLRARYAGESEKGDIERAKRLIGEIKKN